MPNVQSSGERLSLRETLIDFVAAFKGPLATQLLSKLGHDRPELEVRYPELDCKIQMMLQKMLDDLGYFHVAVHSIDNEASIPGYPYVYRLVLRKKDPEWAEKFLPNVFSALLKATHTTDIDLAYNLEKGLAFVKLRPNNRMSVAKERNAAFMQD